MTVNLCRSESLAEATEAGQFTGVVLHTEGERPFAGERSFGEAQL
jgi:hypothetical protein